MPRGPGPTIGNKNSINLLRPASHWRSPLLGRKKMSYILRPTIIISSKTISRLAPGRAVAEGVGFEPTELSFNGFQDRRLKPLGHPSWILWTRLYLSTQEQMSSGLFPPLSQYVIALKFPVHAYRNAGLPVQ